MSVKLVLLVEDLSTRIFLETLLPKLYPAMEFEIRHFRGKSNMKKRLPNRLKAYRSLLDKNNRIIVLVDADNDDCKKLKKEFDCIVKNAQLTTSSLSKNSSGRVYNCIVVKELEAWYFAHWEAVCEAYPKLSKNIPKKQGYRYSDEINKPAKLFEQTLQKKRYYENGLDKRDAARKIADKIDTAKSSSRSFEQLMKAISSAMGAAASSKQRSKNSSPGKT